jgi:hypothetical protein
VVAVALRAGLRLEGGGERDKHRYLSKLSINSNSLIGLDAFIIPFLNGCRQLCFNGDEPAPRVFERNVDFLTGGTVR